MLISRPATAGIHAANFSRFLAALVLLVSCDLNSPTDHGTEQSSTGFTARAVNSDPVGKYHFRDDQFANAGSYSSAYLTPPQSYPSPALDTYEWFFNYRLENFSPKTEPLFYERFGSVLGIKQASLWDHHSYNSHAVGFSVSLPVISVVEYGETQAYGSHTDASESYFYNHLHYLKDLREGTTYHYRVVVKDEDGVVVALPDRTFTTKTFSNEVKLYQKDFTHTVEGSVRPGLWITEPGVYVFMEDIVSDGLGINAKSRDITIDLNGHTLLYDNGRNPFHDEDQYNESASFGIRTGLWNFLNTRIYIGVI
jgi:hypothetical protein